MTDLLSRFTKSLSLLAQEHKLELTLTQIAVGYK